MAILVRRKAAMDMILQALDEADVPVEVIGLGGLLKTPEVTEVVAWLRALETKPGANRWLARILLGPRWRIHYRDLALLSRWSAEQNWSLRVKLAAGDEEQAREMEPGDVGFALAESLGHVDEIESLGEDAKTRLRAFSKQLAVIRRKSNAPLLELVQEIIRHAGIGDALDSSTSDTASAARQNISNFLDQVATFSPVEGEATLRSFISYLDAAEAAEETLEATQPAEQDSVKLMTVHSAKGLEFECIFVPSVASGINRHGDAIWSIFPNTRGSNPLTSYSELPYEVREDAAHLPTFEGKLVPFQKAVRERVIEDERRLFYVALTRAKQRLHVTASWWYGRDRIPKGPSPFWLELEKLAEKGLVDVVERYPEADEKNPLFGAMEDRRVWPPVPRLGLEDPLFPKGWGEVADDVVGGRATVGDLLQPLASEQQKSAQELIEAHRSDLKVIAEAATPPAPVEPRTPDIISATAWVRLQEGEISSWDLVRPFPSHPTSARRIGTEVHRLIEERSRGLSPFADEGDLDVPGASAEPGLIADMLQRFEDRYGERVLARLPSGEPMVELPFTMLKDRQIIRGRIDAVYETPDGGLQVVDFKTGKRFTKSDEADQLELYAEALRALGFGDREVTVDYVFLSEGAETA
jgi:DNA helicase-2/ATP-dependent DNA helicase PcrA